ncbi:MAG: AAA family ATPase [Solirubrobacteraceae bacterium MAG38_C4-C5]|nr:AAA family ATPase [Candidatus Siliceabacter maunaloa]
MSTGRNRLTGKSRLDTHGRPLDPEEEDEELGEPPGPASREEVLEVVAELDRELVGLQTVKARIRELAALLQVDQLRREAGLCADRPTLHMSFTGSPGTGKTTVALRMGQILHRLGYLQKGHLVAVTREDLVGEYVGHTAPKTHEAIKQAHGGVLFIDEAYYLHKPENERDYGTEAIEILLQAMENDRDKLVVVLAGYRERMEPFFSANPGMGSRVAQHVHFPDFSIEELAEIARRMLHQQDYRFTEEAEEAFGEYVELRKQRPRFSNGRSIRNALDRARMRQANRLFDREDGKLSREELETIAEEDIRASSHFDEVFDEGETDPAREDSEGEASEAEAHPNGQSVPTGS